MYKCAKKLMYPVLLMWVAIALTACGGASSGDGGSTTSAVNKPTFSASAASSISEPSSAQAESSISLPTSASSTSQSVSSAYSRISRSSNAAASSQHDSSLDTTPPSTTELQLYRLSERSITLIWDDSTDNVEINHYTIARNGKLLAIVDFPAQMFADQGLLPSTDYSYTITAFDASGNNSGESAVFNIRTLALANSSAAASSQFSASSKSSAIATSSSAKSSTVASSKSAKSSSPSSTSNSKSSITASSTSSTSRSASSNTSSTASSAAIETITITWGHPSQREDGSFLELDEIGGYEIRYRKPNGARFTYINLNGNRTTEHVFTGPVKDLEFEIAVFDTLGLYSSYVKITR